VVGITALKRMATATRAKRCMADPPMCLDDGVLPRPQ